MSRLFRACRDRAPLPPRGARRPEPAVSKDRAVRAAGFQATSAARSPSRPTALKVGTVGKRATRIALDSHQ